MRTPTACPFGPWHLFHARYSKQTTVVWPPPRSRTAGCAARYPVPVRPPHQARVFFLWSFPLGHAARVCPPVPSPPTPVPPPCQPPPKLRPCVVAGQWRGVGRAHRALGACALLCVTGLQTLKSTYGNSTYLKILIGVQNILALLLFINHFLTIA